MTAFSERLIALFRAAERRTSDAVALLQLCKLEVVLNRQPQALRLLCADAG